MLSTIYLNDQQILRTGKVYDERSDRELPSEFVALQATAPQRRPKATLRIGRIATERSRISGQNRQRSGRA
jgi:hypothetical protein